MMQRIVIGFTRILASEDLKQLPEITGVEVSYREQVKKVLNLHWNGQNLPISTQYVYHPESIRAESLAVCDSNESVFFKYALGKGFAVSESIYGPLPQNGYLALKECDGALFIIRRGEVKK